MPREPVPNPENPDSPADAGAIDGTQGLANGLDVQAVNEAIIDSLAVQNDVWGFVDAIQNTYQIPPAQRHRYYNQYITMIAARDPAEQDSLIARGEACFRYRRETARRDVMALRQTDATALRIEPTVVGDDFMAEIVYIPNQPIKYLRYDFDTGATELTEGIDIGNVRYRPTQTRLAEKGALVLPTGVEEYGETGDLINALRAFIDRYLYLESAPFRNICVYYVLLSWIFDRFDVVPYLRAQGEYGTGKTRLLQVIGALGYRTVFAGGATTAAPIFRIIERFHGTLVIDEADFSERSELWAEITKILNTGYQRGIFVLRAERKASNDQYDAESFDCYGPKLLSTRKRFADQALESRCLSHTMQLTKTPPYIPLMLGPQFRDEARVLRNQLLLWRFRRYRFAVADPCERIENLSDRLNQIMLPLLAVSDDAEMRTQILAHAQRYQAGLREDARESWEGKIAECVIDGFRNALKEERNEEKRQKKLEDDAPFSITLKAVGEKFQRLLPDVKIDQRNVSRVVRHVFGLAAPHRSGQVLILVTRSAAEKLCDRYALDKGFLTGAEDETRLPSRIETDPRAENNGHTRREPVPMPLPRTPVTDS